MTIKILHGDVFDGLSIMSPQQVDCVVTSPPYWGLRDYGVSGQLGSEPTIQEYLKNMVRVFEGVKRVLKDDGVLWLNIGDTYAGSGYNAHNKGANQDPDNTQKVPSGWSSDKRGMGAIKTIGGVIKNKDLCLVPQRLAIALQEAGWYVRCDVIWHKPNSMPESVGDRPSKAHEYIWMLTKSERYYYDKEAIMEPPKASSVKRLSQNTKEQEGSDRAYGGQRKMGATMGKKKDKQRGHSRRHAGFNERWDKMTREEQQSYGANKRSVWSIATAQMKEAHFATFPPDLVDICVKATCPEGGVVFDPFMGSGTTAIVADRLGKDCVGIELNPEYVDITRKRVLLDGGMFSTMEVIDVNQILTRAKEMKRG